jgi:NAD(P)-dependent dehydrogenase (short-subunit alcohol dehydrogenase family)
VDHLVGRVGLVTGAAGGIGLAITEAFAAEGMRVVMTDSDEKRLFEHAARLQQGGADLHPALLDVSDPAAVGRVASETLDRYGALHVAVNNAGIVNGGVTWELPLSEWHRVLDVNLWGVIHGIHAFVPLILESGEEGHVVNVASMAAVLAVRKLGPYTAAKHAILGISDVLRKDLAAIGAPVGVSVVMPGRIRTRMNPIGAIEPSTVARNVVDAIRKNRPYVFTDDDSVAEVGDRLQTILDARNEVCS